jgi:hypothetical protein
MNPVNYRRGLLAEMVRKTERARITQLLELQNIRIMPEAQLEHALGMRGLSGLSTTPARSVLHDLARKSGIMTEGMIDDMVERRVIQEMENVLYTWDRGSRLGETGTKFVFPFGRPWADMAGFWGREMLRKPVTRGFWNERNFLGIKSMPLSPLMKGIEKFVPFNPKAAAMMSRLANTDFTIDSGFAGNEGGSGLLPGATSSDFSPLFF